MTDHPDAATMIPWARARYTDNGAVWVTPDWKTARIFESAEVTASALSQSFPTQVASDLFIDGWKQILLDSDFDDGCPVVAATLGRDESPQAADAAADVFSAWTNALATGLPRLGAKPLRDGRRHLRPPAPVVIQRSTASMSGRTQSELTG